MIQATMYLVVLLLSLHTLGLAQTGETVLLASDGDQGDAFGHSVSISGDYALIGATQDEESGSASGSAYVYHYDGMNWIQQAKLTASDGEASDYFGYSVSISGDYAMVGSLYGDNDNGANSGAVYVFHFDGVGWAEETKLTASDSAPDDYFGFSVSLSGDYALVGAWGDGNNVGAVYVFHLEGAAWIEQAKLAASDGAAGDEFGFSVSTLGNLAMVGAPYEDENGVSAGAVYAFRLNGSNWVEEAKLTPVDGSFDNLFGCSVSASGDYVLVGAQYDDAHGDDAGSAYVFHFDGVNWSEEAKLTASDGGVAHAFGKSVSLSGDYALVGANLGNGTTSHSGSAYIYRKDGANWVEEAELTASNGGAEDGFGVSVSLSAEHAVIGAWLNDANGSEAGLAYIYDGFADPIPGIPPVVGDVPDQRIRPGDRFSQIRLDNVVADQDHQDSLIVWTWSGNSNLRVKYDAMRRRVIVRQPIGWTGSETITFTATDPDGLSDSDAATYTVATNADPLEAPVLAQVEDTPTVPLLRGNYPNPFNPSTTISYALPEGVHAELNVFNMLGELVATLVSKDHAAGSFSVIFDGSDLPSGLYVYELAIEGGPRLRQKALLIK